MQMIEYIIVIIIYESLRHLPFRFYPILVNLLIFFAQHIIRYRKTVIIENIKQVFPKIDDKSLSDMVRDVYRNFSQLWVETLQTWRLDAAFISKNFNIHNWEIIEEALKQNSGLILVTGHLGNYEWAVHYCIIRLQNVFAIMKRVKNKRINDLMVRIRELTGGKIIYKKSALRHGLRALADGKSVAIVSDQDAGNRGIFVKFFGKDASTATGAAIFHLKSGAPMVFVCGIRIKFGKLDIHFERIPDSPDKIINDKTIRKITQSHTIILEKWIRKYPTQYFWTHRRWKTEP
jgi:Kdo2-lipid IVA lauroyltransferase/acyltransferase